MSATPIAELLDRIACGRTDLVLDAVAAGVDPGSPGRDGVPLHLSSFAGDGVAGGVPRILVADVNALHVELRARRSRRSRAGRPDVRHARDVRQGRRPQLPAVRERLSLSLVPGSGATLLQRRGGRRSGAPARPCAAACAPGVA